MQFEEQVEALTGIAIDGSSDPTQTELSAFLQDGVKDVVNRMIEARPAELSKFTATTNSTSSITKTGKILSVVREHDSTSILRKCTAIDPGDRYEATDVDSLLYRSKTSPGFYELDGAIYTVPTAGSGNNGIVVTQVHYDTGLVYGDTVGSGIDNFPTEYEYLVALYAAIQSLQAAMGDMSGSFNADIGTALTATNTELDETQAVCDKIDADLVLAKAEIVLAKGEAAEIVTFTDGSSSTFQVACDAMKTELDKVDNVIVEASTEFDKVDNVIVEASTEYDEAKNLSAAYNSGAIATALDAIQANVDLANTIVDSPPVPPDVPTLSAQSVSITGTAPVYTKPTVQGGSDELTDVTAGTLGSAETDFDEWFHIAGQYLEDQEDAELASAQLQKIAAYISAFSQEMTSAMNVFNDANVEYQAILQKDIKDADLSDANEARKIQKYSTEIAEYQAELGEMNQRVQGYLNTAQGYSNEVQAYATAGQTFINTGNAYLAEANAIAGQGSAYISEAQAYISQAQGYAAEVGARSTFVGAKSQAVQGHISTAQSYVASAQGFASEVQSKINIANGYIAETTARLQSDVTKYQWFQEQSLRLKTQYDAAFISPGASE